jgi:hypothetical protein
MLALAPVSACGKKIGDACQLPSDCSADGSRICELNSPDGYCTIAGCDFGTCPSESVCVRFFPGVSNAPHCDSQADCDFDQICTVANVCAPRAGEIRFCMLSCGSDGDCRDGYECRTLLLMQEHGGEPVPDPQADAGPPASGPVQQFCAQRRACSTPIQCPVTEACESSLTCGPRNTCSQPGDSNCSSGIEICNTTLGQCVRPCTVQVDCEEGEVCNPTTMFCDKL